jgi:hypothetical protein
MGVFGGLLHISQGLFGVIMVLYTAESGKDIVCVGCVLWDRANGRCKHGKGVSVAHGCPLEEGKEQHGDDTRR